MKKRKALVFFGSPRNNGHTQKMLDFFMDELHEFYDFSVINAYDIAIRPCYGCNFCIENSQCQFSDFNQTKKLLDETDMLIIASPIYNLGFPAPLKAIFDRLQPFYNKKLFLKEQSSSVLFRDAVLLLTCGRSGNKILKILEKNLNLILKCIDLKLKYKIIWENTDLNSDFSEVGSKLEKISNLIKL